MKAHPTCSSKPSPSCSWTENKDLLPGDGAWDGFLGRRDADIDLERPGAPHADRCILVTGAGGSIGSALAAAILACRPRRLLLLDHAEDNLHEVYTRLAASAIRPLPVLPLLGDVCHAAWLESIFEEHRPEMVYHAAAFKHVPLAEANPFTVVRNNVLGTYALARAALRHGAAQLLMISTDKAANPRSVMGVSKRIAELVLLGLDGPGLAMKAVRLGNVLGSRGSVGPLFQAQIAQGGPLTVTHRDARRYFVSPRGAIEIVFMTAFCAPQGGIYFPELGEQFRVMDLAHYLARQAGFTPEREIPMVFTGLRSGDKLSEDMVSSRESVERRVASKLFRVRSPEIAAEDLEAAMADLERRSCLYDLPELLNALRVLVPEYQPGEWLMEPVQRSRSAPA